MKGIVFNLTEEIIRRHYGQKLWDDLLESANLQGAYTSLGSYADEDLVKLVSAAANGLHKTEDEVVRWIGREAAPLLAVKYPKLFAEYDGTRSFVLDLNSIIHPEVRKLYPGANVPEFDFDATVEGQITVGYQSPRQMCAFAHGLIEGSALHYGESASVQHLRCMKKGDTKCVFQVNFARQP